LYEHNLDDEVVDLVEKKYQAALLIHIWNVVLMIGGCFCCTVVILVFVVVENYEMLVRLLMMKMKALIF
jgi:hypothetical protein